jgi:hypothetical protein
MDIAGGVPLWLGALSQHGALEIAKPAVTICTRLVTRDAALRRERLLRVRGVEKYARKPIVARIAEGDRPLQRRNVLLRVLRERAFGRNQREGCVAGAAGQNDKQRREDRCQFQHGVARGLSEAERLA